MKIIKKLLIIIGIIVICILVGFIVSILRFYSEIIGLILSVFVIICYIVSICIHNKKGNIHT